MSDGNVIDDRCTVPFLRVCEFLETVQNLRRTAKTQSLRDFYQHSRVTNFFPIVRLIVPSFDMERGNYGLKETTLAKYYSELLSLPNQHREALIHFKNPKKQLPGCVAGGFVEILEFILQDRVGDSQQLTVEQVNGLLDQLALAPDKDSKKKALTGIVRHMNVLEQKWVVRIILKDMKIGASDSILKAFHPQAVDLYSYTNNLREVFAKLKDPTATLGLQLFTFGQPIKPMLAGRKPYDDLKQLLITEAVYVETKFDGERIHAHWSLGNIKYFSRNAVDVTYLYSTALNDVLTANVEGVQACIFDGELIVWDLVNNMPAPFGSNKTVALDRPTDKALCYMVFDVLYIERHDGEKVDLMKKPLTERKELLRVILREVPHRLEKVRYKELKGFKAVFDEFNRALERSEEGLILKQVSAPYVPDDRSVLWLKMKSEYFEGLSDTLDLLIVGAYYGKSHRIGTEGEFDHITVFLVAVASRIDLKDPKRSKFIPLCKVGTGYSFGELGELRRKLKPHWRPFRQSPDYWPSWVPKAGERPDYVIIDPSQSVVLEVRGAELVTSDKFPTGHTVRFPRVDKIRYDKSWDQATSYTELKELITTAGRKLNQPNNAQPATKRKREVKRTEKGAVLDAFRDTDTDHVTQMSELFDGCLFYIASSVGFDKPTLETLLVTHGGRKVQNYSAACTHVLAGEASSMKVTNLIQKHHLDVISPQWLLDCVTEQRVIELKPKYMLNTSAQLQAKFDQEYNAYGDSRHSAYVHPQELLDIAAAVPMSTVNVYKNTIGHEWWALLPEHMQKAISTLPRFKLVRECVLLLSPPETLLVNGRDLLAEIIQCRLRAHGARVTTQEGPEVTMVVYLSHDTLEFPLEVPVFNLESLTELLTPKTE